MRIGVYICHCGVNIAATVDVEDVTHHAAKLPYVAVATNYQYLCSDPGQALIKKDIKEKKLDRVVVAACSPRMHEPTFRSTLEDAGLNPYCLEMVNIREQCSWVHADKKRGTEKAKVLVGAGAARAKFLEPLKEKEVKVTPRALVVGGGIAGMQASLDLANTGFKVYLVEKEPTIGGRMAQLDKTFPTLDCSACILTPKMMDVGIHPNIELLTPAEVREVEGYVGNFKVTVLKKPRYVTKECTACGDCVDVCPVVMPNEFDLGLASRKAIYMPFPQAVPFTYIIDMESCLGNQPIRCNKCAEVCEPKAVDLDQMEEELELEVGTIIVATGYEEFDAKLKPEYGYGKYPEVITGLEFERLSSASGPTGGELVINGKVPKRVVFISCVGSRDQQIGNEYCSRVCCMYTAKQAHLVKEKIPDADVLISYMDVRAFGKGFEEFYDRVRAEGIRYRRGNVGEVFKRGDKLIVRAEDTLVGEVYEEEADLVVLATGTVAGHSTKKIASLFNLSQGPDGFLLEAHPKLRPVDSSVRGIYLAGCAQGPKDIPDTVAQAKGAASSATILMEQGKAKIEALTPVVDEERCSACLLCVPLCPYDALSLDEEKNVVTVKDVVCEGCGSCGSACPTGALRMKNYTDEQILVQVESLARG